MNRYQSLFSGRFDSETMAYGDPNSSFLTIFGMVLSANGYELPARLLHFHGVKLTSAVVHTLSGMTPFPTDEEYALLMETAVCYFYKEVERRSWDEVKSMVDFKVVPNSMAKRIRKVKSKIKERWNVTVNSEVCEDVLNRVENI